MNYRELVDVEEIVKNEGKEVAIEKIKYEIALNLFEFNNSLFSNKYETVGEVFSAFPKGGQENELPEQFLLDVYEFTQLSYAQLPGGMYSTDEIFSKYLDCRDSIKRFFLTNN